MNRILFTNRNRSLGKLVLLAAAMWLLSACGTQEPIFQGLATSTPTPTATPDPASLVGPPPPLQPGTVGSGVGEPGTITDLTDALACLSDGLPVYALVERNANVRSTPTEDGCDLGRANAGAVVRVEGIYSQGESEPLVTLARREPNALASIPAAVGFAEDIQPLFQQTCASCHGDQVQTRDLQVTEYEPLMAGSERGPVVVPGDPEASKLWEMVSSGAMPLVGELAPEQKRLVFDWIAAGAPETRPNLPTDDALWLQIRTTDVTLTDNNCQSDGSPFSYVSASLVRVASCAVMPTAAQLAQIRPSVRPQSDDAPVAAASVPDEPAEVAANAAAEAVPEAAPAETTGKGPNAAAAPVAAYAPGQARIQAAPLGLSAPSDADPWMAPRGGFCVERHLQQKLDGQYGITSLAFAPDGRLFIGLDAPSTGEVDPNVLFDAFHPSRSIAVYHSVNGDSFYTILDESSRVTGMAYHNGALYLNRAGEVGRIPDGGSYEKLAGGFAVNGRLFHANNGIAIVDGWVYISAGGVRDGYSDGIINPGDGDVPAETMAVNIAGNGNTYAARVVRARLDQLLSQRSINVFQTALRGVRNPYGITADPYGRLWFTDNGATNVGEEYFAGDEVNLFDPRTLSPAAAAGDESQTPFYGFPIVLSGNSKDWYTGPVLPLVNTSAPTGITWAYGTIFFAQYGRDPGLYRLADAGGQLVAERVLLGWPIQAVTTAPDGAIWIGTGNGGLYRLVAGCG